MLRAPLTATERDRCRAVAVAALRSPHLARAVDLVCWPELAVDRDRRPLADGPAYSDGSSPRRVLAVHVADHAGQARLDAEHPDGVTVSGRSPLIGTDARALLDLQAQRAGVGVDGIVNSYPYAWQRLSSLFRDPRSPDVAIVHTPGHWFPERGGHRGEHGSLDVLQSRAPLLLSGPGVVSRGVVAGSARLVDVTPTLAHVCGVPRTVLEPLDGVVRDDLVRPGAQRVLGLLWDGAHAGTLVQLAADGTLPNVARLLDHGCLLDGGAVAEFPSLTLVNHTSLLTGVGPGRHGVVGNAYRDPVTGLRQAPNDPSTWHRSADYYRDGTRTLFELIGASVPGARTASVNEMTERGATASTMALVRAGLAARTGSGAGGELQRGFRDLISAMLPDPFASPLVTHEHAQHHDDYRFYSAVDLMGLAQVTGLMGAAEGPPLLTWWSSYVTDAAHHAAGPFSGVARDAFADADARLGVLLDQLRRDGILESTLILLTADHGFEAAREDCTGDWLPALAEALDPLGVPWVDEGPGFLYLGVSP